MAQSARKANPGKKKAVQEAVEDAFNPYGNITTVLDLIEKELDISDGGLVPNEARMSTGLLCLDILLGGGITAGWYTNFGQEQSCKTTLAVNILFSALFSRCPILAYWDFEGCLAKEATLRLEGNKDVSFEQLAEMYSDGDQVLGISTVGGASATGTFRVIPDKPLHSIRLDDGTCFRGYKHPFLVWDPFTEEAEWVLLENLKVGMTVLRASPLPG